MDKLEKIRGVFQTLRERGIVTNKKEFAALLGVEYTGLVSAIKGRRKDAASPYQL